MTNFRNWETCKDVVSILNKTYPVNLKDQVTYYSIECKEVKRKDFILEVVFALFIGLM